MEKVGNEGVITVEEAKSLDTELEVVQGMQFALAHPHPAPAAWISSPKRPAVKLAWPHRGRFGVW